ncbi:hypothetical protein Tco_0259908, partial [Tanacetum coccineum]
MDPRSIRSILIRWHYFCFSSFTLIIVCRYCEESIFLSCPVGFACVVDFLSIATVAGVYTSARKSAMLCPLTGCLDLKDRLNLLGVFPDSRSVDDVSQDVIIFDFECILYLALDDHMVDICFQVNADLSYELFVYQFLIGCVGVLETEGHLADDCDAFDSDADEAPMAQTMFMANLSSADPVYDEAGPSYDSEILSE